MSDRDRETVVVSNGGGKGSGGWIAAVLIAIAAVGVILWMTGTFDGTGTTVNVEQPATPAAPAPAEPAPAPAAPAPAEPAPAPAPAAPAPAAPAN